MAGLMTPSVGSFVPVGETEERTKRLARAAADKQLAESTRQFDLGYGLDRDRFNENVRQFGLGYALDQQRLAENTRQFDLGFNENARQFDLGHDLSKAEDARSAEAWQWEVEARDAIKAGSRLPDSGGRSVELAPRRERPTSAQRLLSGSSVAPTVDMPGGLPMGGSGTAGLAVPNLDLAPPASSYSGVSTKDLIDQLSGAENVAAARGSDMFREAPSAFSASGEPSPGLVERRMQRFGETEEEAKAWLRSEWSRRQQNTAALAKAAGGLGVPGIPESPPYRAGVATPEDFQFGMGAYEPPQLPTPEAPQVAGFDFSRRAQALQEKEAYMQRAMQLAGIDAYLSGNPSQLRALQAEYAQLGNERALVAGVNALQAATMGDITPLRQFLADQYGTGDVQIYPMADGTLEIEVNGQSLGRTTLADIRQQLLADLDPATQQAAAAEAKFQRELFLKALPEWFKQAQERGEIKDVRFIEPVDTENVAPFLYYNRDGRNYMVPMTTTTIGGAETIRFGEEQPIGAQ